MSSASRRSTLSLPASARPAPRPENRPRRHAPVMWTPSEIAWLQRNFAQALARVLRARFAYRCFADVYLMARTLGLAWEDVEPGPDLADLDPREMGCGPWTLEQLRELRVMSRRGATLHELKQILGRPRREMRKLLLYMGCSPVRPPAWSPEQDIQLAQAFAAAGGHKQAVVRIRGRLEQDIHWRLVFLGLKHGKSQLDQPWEERYLVRAVGAHYRVDEMAYSLQAHPQALFARALALGCSPLDLQACINGTEHRRAPSGAG